MSIEQGSQLGFDQLGVEGFNISKNTTPKEPKINDPEVSSDPGQMSLPEEFAR